MCAHAWRSASCVSLLRFLNLTHARVWLWLCSFRCCRYRVDPRDTVGTAVDYVGKPEKSIILKGVKLPQAFLSSFYVTFELYEHGMLGASLIGSAQVPVRAFIDSFLTANPKLASSYEAITSADIVAPTTDGATIAVLPDAEATAQAAVEGGTIAELPNKDSDTTPLLVWALHYIARMTMQPCFADGAPSCVFFSFPGE